MSDVGSLTAKRAHLEATLENIEQQIYQLEGNYLQDTQQYGNVVIGWGENGSQKFKESDRIFSKSSSTSSKNVSRLTKRKASKLSSKKMIMSTDMMDLDD